MDEDAIWYGGGPLMDVSVVVVCVVGVQRCRWVRRGR